MGANGASGKGIQYSLKNMHQNIFRESYEELTPVFVDPNVLVFKIPYFD
jgi:hypothetical protein